MENEDIQFIKLERYPTKDIKDQHVNGSLAMIFRDGDNIIKYLPKMVYVSSVNPGEIKGPHLHTKRDSYFVCIHGKVVFIIKDKNGQYRETESGEDNPILVHVPKNYLSSHLNLSNGVSRVLALVDTVWGPNDNEMQNVTFDDYDWLKWNKTK